uniref:ORF81 n=1 Tax=Malaco herpesvirus 1 TaxID=3031797 RepID=A0AA48SFH7_9VIRU|nr:TPA_asm: ORF81 [Malaco herpesvirus 1]
MFLSGFNHSLLAKQPQHINCSYNSDHCSDSKSTHLNFLVTTNNNYINMDAGKIQKAMLKKMEDQKIFQSTIIRKMIQGGETTTTLFDGGFVAYPKTYVQPKFEVLSSKQFNVRVIRGAGTADSQYVTPGLIFPQYPTTLAYNSRGIEMVMAERFNETAIILNGGEVFDKASELLPRPSGVSDEAIVNLGKMASSMELSNEFKQTPGGIFNVISDPFDEDNLTEFVDMMFTTHFPECNKDTHVLIFIGNKPSMISIVKYYLLGAEDVNKYNIEYIAGEKTQLADHRCYYGQTTFEVPFNNAHLNRDCDGLVAKFLPVFHASNKVCVNEQGLLPYNENSEEYRHKAVQEFIKLQKKMVTKRDDMKQINTCKFIGTVAANILLEDPVMSVVGCTDDPENPKMILNARMDIIYSTIIQHKGVNSNVKVKEHQIFQTAYAGKVEKSMISPCKSLSYRVSFDEDVKPMEIETLRVTDAKGKPVRNFFAHKTDRAATSTSFFESLKKDIPNMTPEQKQLQAGMLMVNNNLIQILDPQAVFNTDVFESRNEKAERVGATIDESNAKSLGFMTAIKAGPDSIARNIDSPAMRILSRLNGSIFLFKEVVDMCLKVTNGKTTMEPGCDHPGMIGEEVMDTTFCSWCQRKFVDNDDMCFCALLTQSACNLKVEDMTHTKVSALYSIAFPSKKILTLQDEKKITNMKMESYALHMSIRTNETGNKMSCVGNVTLKNNNSKDENGLMSLAAYENRKANKAGGDKDGSKAPADSTPSTSGKDGEEEKDTDFSKCKKVSALLDTVLQSNPTILKDSHRVDFSVLGKDELAEISQLLLHAHKQFNKSVTILNEIEKNSFKGRTMTSGVGSFTLEPNKALIASILEDETRTKDYTIPQVQKGLPALVIKGAMVEEEVKTEEDEDDEDDVMAELMRSNQRKRKMNMDDGAPSAKKAKSETLSQDIKNFARALYVYCLENMNNSEFEPHCFKVENMPEEYKKVIGSPAKFKQAFIYIGYMVGMNTEHKLMAEQGRTTRSNITKTMADYIFALGDYLKETARIIQIECGFQTPEQMNDRFFMHTSQTESKIGKQLTGLIDPSSTGDFVQKMTERKMLNAMGKQHCDVKRFTCSPVVINETEITIVMKQNNIPNVVQTSIPIPYNFQKGVNTDEGTCMIEQTTDLSNYTVDGSFNKKQGGLPQVNQHTYTVMLLKINGNAIAGDRKEIKEETWNSGRKVNTEKLDEELNKIYDQTKQGIMYKSFPLTCADYVAKTDGCTGAGKVGPLSTPILSALHSKNNVRYDRVNMPNFASKDEDKKASEYVLNFIQESRSVGANNDACYFSTFNREIIRDLGRIRIAHEQVVKKMIPIITKMSSVANTAGFEKALRDLYIGKQTQTRFDDLVKRTLSEYNNAGPILHLFFALGQIYGSKVFTGNQMYNVDMERDYEAARISTTAVINLLTSRDANQSTTSSFKSKNQGLGTSVTCHSNFSMMENKPVVMCTVGDFDYNSHARCILKGSIGSYYGIDGSTINRSIKMGTTFFNQSVPAEIVGQDASAVKIGTNIIIKTGGVHFNRSEKVIQTVDPHTIMMLENLESFKAALTSKNIAKKFFEYIRDTACNGTVPETIEEFNKIIIENYLPHMSDYLEAKRVEEEFTSIIASGFISEEEEYVEDCDFDMFDFGDE